MPGTIRNTVDRLDKPSAYYQSRVSCASIVAWWKVALANISFDLQNKKRKYDRDNEDREKTPEEPAEDPLKDATTLYVGNL